MNLKFEFVPEDILIGFQCHFFFKKRSQSIRARPLSEFIFSFFIEILEQHLENKKSFAPPQILMGVSFSGKFYGLELCIYLKYKIEFPVKPKKIQPTEYYPLSF